MPLINQSAIDAFKKAVQQVAKNYIDKPNPSVIRYVKKHTGYTADAQATLIQQNTSTGREFLEFFKTQLVSLNSRSSLLADLVTLLPQILQWSVGEPIPDNTQELYLSFCQALSELAVQKSASKQLQVVVDDTLTESVSSDSLSCSPPPSSFKADKVLDKWSVSGLFDDVVSTPAAIPATTQIPTKPHCPITLDEMVYPVQAADGQIYEKAALMEYIRTKNRSFEPAESPVEARWELESGRVRPGLTLTGSALTYVPEAVGNPQASTLNYVGSQGYQPGADMFTRHFLGGELLKIEIGSNFINVYRNFVNTDTFKLITNTDLLSRFIANYEVNDNIQRLAGVHHLDDFSICKDHCDYSYANPVFSKMNQSSQNDHFHPTQADAGHTHLVYGWDAVSVKDILALFSYVSCLDPTVINHSEVLKLLSDYLKFMVKQMLPLFTGSTANAEVVDLLRSISRAPAVFEADGRLSIVIAAKLNLISARDLVGVRAAFQNDRLHQSFTVMLSDLRAIGQDPSQLICKASDFSCNPPSSTMSSFGSQHSTASSPGNMQGSGTRLIPVDLNRLLFLLSQNGPNG